MEDGPIKVGEIVGGKYRVDAILGQGGMGVVVRATHLQLETAVAIKFLLSRSKGEAELRFLREGRIAARLKSQHAAKVVDVGLHGAAPFLVMEYLEGEDLAALIGRTGVLSIEDAVTYVLQACEALAEAHSLGIIHRDVKPANLMLTKGPGGAPCIKVLDFGVSKAVGSLGAAGTEEARLTAASQMLGSPLYMAPEQVSQAATADGRADIWSIGVVLYQLLTGTTPWTGTSILALLCAMVKEPPTPIAQLRPDVPAGLCAVIFQCIEQDRDRRWSNIADFAAALAPYGQEPVEAVLQRIASSHRLPVPEPARPTEPMPAPGETSSFGWFGEAPAAEAKKAERPLLPSRSDDAPEVMPARTSAASPDGVVGNDRVLRGIAIGVPIVAAVIIAIVVLRSSQREPKPIAMPVETREVASSYPATEPSVEVARAASVATAAPATAPPPTGATTPATAPSPRPKPPPAPPPPVPGGPPVPPWEGSRH